MKLCSRCQDIKVISEFTKESKQKDGLSYWCRTCKKEDARIRNLQKKLGTYESNQAKRRKQTMLTGLKQCVHCKEWKGTDFFSKVSKSLDGLHNYCKQCKAEYDKKDWQKHRNKRIKNQKIRYRENRDEYIAMMKRWQRNNKLKIRNRSSMRRALLRSSSVEYVNRMDVYDRDRGICYLCQDNSPIDLNLSYLDPFSFTIDHIIPISKGGEHTYENIKTAHRICNMKKHAKLLEELIRRNF